MHNSEVEGTSHIVLNFVNKYISKVSCAFMSSSFTPIRLYKI